MQTICMGTGTYSLEEYDAIKLEIRNINVYQWVCILKVTWEQNLEEKCDIQDINPFVNMLSLELHWHFQLQSEKRNRYLFYL